MVAVSDDPEVWSAVGVLMAVKRCTPFDALSAMETRARVLRVDVVDVAEFVSRVGSLPE